MKYKAEANPNIEVRIRTEKLGNKKPRLSESG